MKVLLSGPGAFGIKHLDGIKNIDGVEVVSLVGRTLDKTQAVADQYGIKHVATDLAEALKDMGCYEISLGDTIGQATPERIRAMLKAVIEVVHAGQLAGHYHDTAGRALDNIEASLDCGVRVFDAAVGGLGGCPYAPGAAGNVATEAVDARLKELGYDTGLDAAIIAKAGEMARAMRAGS